jgi:hypothetical protein
MSIPSTSFQFVDRDSGDNGWGCIERKGDAIMITFSLRQGADIDLFLSKEDAQKVLDRLQKAISTVDENLYPFTD